MTGSLFHARQRVGELERDVSGLENLWTDYGAEYGDRLSEAEADLDVARRELERLGKGGD